MWRVAVVGSGPAGIYASAALLAADETVRVDVLDRLPCPYGLVRYGVAPDHPKIKSVTSTLESTLDDPRVRFLGNVRVAADLDSGPVGDPATNAADDAAGGLADLPVRELRLYYDAVVYAVGASAGRRLGIPGEDLPGSVSGVDLVRWYSGHPDTRPDAYRLRADTVVVVGAGNVALDVARVLSRRPDEFTDTDMPPDVLAELKRSQVRDVHLMIRRGPAQTKFSTPELREIGRLADVDVVVDPAELEGAATLATTPAATRNVEVLRQWSERALSGAQRRIHLHFHRRPTRLVGPDRVTAVEWERTDVPAAGSLPAELVVSCIGYRVADVPGVPADPATGLVLSDDGRVLREGRPVPGLYVAGWVKRGPTGVIGTNKRDAGETVASLLQDRSAGLLPPVAADADLLETLRDRGVPVVTWAGWRQIEQAEARLGAQLGRPTAKIVDRDGLLAAASSPYCTAESGIRGA